jgi:hypothetical protein
MSRLVESSGATATFARLDENLSRFTGETADSVASTRKTVFVRRAAPRATIVESETALLLPNGHRVSRRRWRTEAQAFRAPGIASQNDIATACEAR